MRKLLPLLLSLLLIGCINGEDPTVEFAENNPEVIRDGPLMSHLPVQLDSTGYLIHPIGAFSIPGGENSGYFPTSDSQSNGFFGGNADEFHGELSNLRFEKAGSESFNLLTEKEVKITQFNFLREVFDNTGKQFLVYEVIEQDWNRNETLDSEDMPALYISNSGGKNFNRLTPEGQFLVDWRLIPQQNKLYFRSISDSNENRELEKEDKLQYFYLDLDLDVPEVVEYFPMNKREVQTEK